MSTSRTATAGERCRLARRPLAIGLVGGLLALSLPTDVSAWWHASWKLRRKIYFKSGTLAEDLTSFPVLVRLDSTRVEYFRTQDAGQDIRFVDADDTTQLAHEIERWDEGGSSYVWVRVPQVSGGTNADYMWMYYDNAGASNGENMAGVWDTGFMMVQHLDETTGDHVDSATAEGTANDSSVVNVVVQGSEPGRIDGADLFAGAHEVQVPDSANLNMGDGDSFTVEAWVRIPSGVDSWRVVVSKEDTVPRQYQLWVFDNGDGTSGAGWWLHDGTNQLNLGGSSNVRNDQLHYLVGRWNNVTGWGDIFVDGISEDSGWNGSLGDLTSPNNLFIGLEGDLFGSDGPFDGVIDEVRISKAARSDDWIRGQHLSMTDNFLEFGPVACASGCQGLSATEGSGLVTVTSANAFELVFANGAGGHLRDFYDLEESPLRDAVHDLAGGLSGQAGLFFDEVSWAGPVPPAANYRSDRSPGVGRGLVVPLEVTPTRVIVRSLSSFTSGTVLPGLKGVGDWTVYPAGRVALHWRRPSTSAVPISSEQLHLNVHYQSSGALSTWAAFNRSGPIADGGGAAVPPNLQDFLLFQNEQAGARTDFLQVTHLDWPRITQMDAATNAGSEWFENTWHDLVAHTIPTDNTDGWSLLTWFKPTVFTGDTDPAVVSRSDDYRSPDDLAAPSAPAAGGGWFDSAESTASPSDFFNEKEAAYTLDLDPAAGLVFDMDGGTTARHQPFFKIRQWRSLGPPTTINLEGVTLTRDAGFKADVMPFSRGGLHRDLLWHSTLHDAAAVTSPDVGSTGSLSGSPSWEGARFGQGTRLSASGDSIRVPTAGNFNAAKGSVSFWFRPAWASTDGVHHDLCGFVFNGTNLFVLEKRTDNNLYFRITASGTTSEVQVAAADYSWEPGEWVNLQIEWDDSLGLANQQRLYFGDREPTHVDPTSDYDSSVLSVAATFRFGNADGDATFAPGVYDEIEIVSDVTLLSRGGLLSSANEYYADPTRNQQIDFGPVDADRRGRYLYFGSTVRFRGLNVGLSVPGAGVPADALLWEYWNGTAWTSLEGGGFTDTTSSLTRSGSVYWTSDPAGWAPYSTFGGVEIYRIRVHLPAGFAYTTFPTEGLIKTDVLLLQYCGDITADAQTFSIAPPLPTAVELMGFSAHGLDSAVELRWSTGSELDNLGFHVYRGPSADGPWARLTSSLIPGLGSSPLGQAYSWLDTGLVNGTRYYYRLEDVDTSSKSTFHGPVWGVPGTASSVPVPSPPGENGDGDGGGDGTEGGGEEADGSCPSWILAAAPDAPSPTCTRHGDPEAVSFQVLSRDAHAATLELRTGGFWTLEEASGTVRVFVRGLDFPADPKAPALPLRRALVPAVVGKQVRLVSAEAFDLQSSPGLRPSAVGRAEMAVGQDGTVRPARRSVGARFLSRGLAPSEVARLAGTVFQGERKSAVVEIAPVRFSASRNELVLAGRVRVKLRFAGAAAGEVPTGGGGRVLPRKGQLRKVLAQLHTSRRGLHAVKYEDLFPTDRRGVPATLLRLQRQGEAVRFHLEPAKPVFGPGSVLYFFADRTPSSTEYSSEVAYELVRGSGIRMGVVSAPPAGSPVPSSSTAFTSFETNRVYQPGLLEAADIWLWEGLVSGAARRFGLTLSGVDTASGEQARLVVRLQGGSESGFPTDHHVRVSLNGADVGEVSFAGKQAHAVTAFVPASLLREGGNEVSLTNVGDTGVSSLVFLDRFELSYPQASTTQQGVFEGVWTESGTVEVGGVSAPVVILRDSVLPGPEGSATADPSSPATSGAPRDDSVRWLSGFQTTSGSVRFQAEAGHRYTVVSPEGLLKPRIGRVPPSALKAGTNQADYLVIAPREFLEAAGPLVERRRSQGLVSRAVSFEEITSEFGKGQPSAEAIRAFLKHAYHSWQRPSPRYVVLLGDATYDPRHFLSTSWASPLPALWEKTSYLWTASDPALAAVNGEDVLPDLAIGRLPATTREQAEALVSKLLAWEDSGQGLSGNAVLVADTPDAAGDFEGDVEDVRRSFLADRTTTTLMVRELGAGTRTAILGALDEGASMTSYVGHGGTAVWSSANVLNSWDTPSLRAQSRQPLLLTLNCLNGYFVAPNFDSLAEALVKAEGRGAIAALSPSGLSLDGPAHQYHRALMAEVTSGRHERLGEAILAAQETYAQTGLMPELLTVFQLLGDPSTRIRPAP